MKQHETICSTLFNQSKLNEIFPLDRADSFFDALFGGAEEGAYNITLTFVGAEQNLLRFGFELKQRPGHCLACNLTSGLPGVFERHPILNVKQVAADLADIAGWPQNGWAWKLASTQQLSSELHFIPLTLNKI